MVQRRAIVNRWFQPEGVPADAAVRLFLLPYAGGNAGVFRDWLPLFPADIAAQAVQPPGRLDRRDEPLLTDLGPMTEALGEAIAAELDGRPFALFGHSMGGLLAYRVAVLLAAEYGATPMLVASAGWTPEGFSMPTLEQVQLPQPELVSWIVGLGSLPPVIYQDPELLELTIPPTRADLTACARYVDDGAPVPCPVISYTGRDDPLLTADAPESWNGRSPEYLGNSAFPGGHFFIYAAALPIAADLTRHLRRLAALTSAPGH